MIDIPNYEGLYAVTLDGEIYSHRTGKIKKPVRHKQGYRSVTLVAQDGKISGYLIHRLVATVLIPNKDNKPFVNHKDCDRTNNHPDNLEWCSRQENMNHAKLMGRMIGKTSRPGKQNGNYKHGKYIKGVR